MSLSGSTDASAVFPSTEVGKVSRNCTEWGWSDTFPHYIDACLYEEGNSSHVVSSGTAPEESLLCFLTVILARPCVPGHVLRVGQGALHRGLQHLPGVPHHGHGDPLQVQVRVLTPSFSQSGDSKTSGLFPPQPGHFASVTVSLCCGQDWIRDLDLLGSELCLID